MFCITNYTELYMPTDTKGRPLKNASYVKLPVKLGGRGFKTLMSRYADGCLIFGIWCMLLELATDQKPKFRGELRNHKDEPASIDEICLAIELYGHSEHVQGAINSLIEMGWMEVRTESVPGPYPVRTESDFSGNELELEGSGIRGEGSGQGPPSPSKDQAHQTKSGPLRPPANVAHDIALVWASKIGVSCREDEKTIEKWLASGRSSAWILEAIKQGASPHLGEVIMAHRIREEKKTGLKPGDAKTKTPCKPCTVPGCVPNKAYLFLDDKAYCPNHRAEHLKAVDAKREELAQAIKKKKAADATARKIQDADQEPVPEPEPTNKGEDDPNYPF